MTASMKDSDARQVVEVSDQLEEIEVPSRLSWMQRVVAGIVAVLAGVAGGIAVFVTDNGAGSVALMGSGLLFGLMALSGRPLVSAKLGDSEVVFAKALTRSLVRVTNEASPEVAKEIAGALAEAGAQTHQPLVNWARSHLYEKAVSEALRDVAQEEGFKLMDLTRLADSGADFQLKRHDGLIDVQVKKRVTLHTLIPGSGRSNLLIITQEAYPGAVELLERQGTRVVTWVAATDNEALRKAVEELASQFKMGR
jgi:hypothetical protein